MKKSFPEIFVRYLTILILGLGNLFVFYKVFTFPTIWLSAKVLTFFGEVIVIDQYIIFNESLLEVARACVAGSAYYLLFLLGTGLTLSFSKRIKLFAFSFSMFFFINVLRIVFMSLIVEKTYFEFVHLLFWHVFSTIFVIVIWFVSVKIFQIKEIPFYSDFLFIKNLKKSKSQRKHN